MENKNEIKEILGLKDRYPRSVRTETSGFIDAMERLPRKPSYQPLTEEQKKKLNANLKDFHDYMGDPKCC